VNDADSDAVFWRRGGLLVRMRGRIGTRERQSACSLPVECEVFSAKDPVLARDRKRVEMLFAHLKRILRLGRLRLRGPCGAQFEFMLAAIAQNLRKLAKLIVRPPPKVVACGAWLGGCQSNSLNTAAPPERMPSNGTNKSLRSLCSLIADFCNRIGHSRTHALQQFTRSVRRCVRAVWAE
jgi:hypothetical protein